MATIPRPAGTLELAGSDTACRDPTFLNAIFLREFCAPSLIFADCLSFLIIVTSLDPSLPCLTAEPAIAESSSRKSCRLSVPRPRRVVARRQPLCFYGLHLKAPGTTHPGCMESTARPEDIR